MDQAMNELNIKDPEFGYVHAVSGPGKILFSFPMYTGKYALGCLVIYV